jgi:predicted NAD/FAD-dependent oxidoreductase
MSQSPRSSNPVPEVDSIVIGAGISGLLAARTLVREGLRVRVLDKGRGVGGRMATRRLDRHRFDHGAQSLMIRDQVLLAVAREWQQQSIIRPCAYPAASDTQIALGPVCGRGGINAIPMSLAGPLDVYTGLRVTLIDWIGSSWRVCTEDDTCYSASALILTPPVPQAMELVDAGEVELNSEIASPLREIEYEPCIAVMLILDVSGAVLESGFVQPGEGPVTLLVDNYVKGVSESPGALTIHTTADFARADWARTNEEVSEQVLRAARHWLPVDPVSTVVHRWRYSRCTRPHTDSHVLVDHPGPLAFAGDGFAGEDIEGAALSGIAAAKAVTARLT